MHVHDLMGVVAEMIASPAVSILLLISIVFAETVRKDLVQEYLKEFKFLLTCHLLASCNEKDLDRSRLVRNSSNSVSGGGAHLLP